MEHKSFIRTRFCESDALGHINNVSYFIYFEQARVDFFMDAEIFGNLKDWSFVLVSTHCDFKKQAFINQDLIVTTSVSHIGNTSVKLKHQILNQTSEEVIAEEEEVLVSFNIATQKTEPLTERIVEKLKLYTE